MSSAVQQLLCACISAVMRSPNTCCASGYQLVGDIRKKTSCPPSGRLAVCGMSGGMNDISGEAE